MTPVMDSGSLCVKEEHFLKPKSKYFTRRNPFIFLNAMASDVDTECDHQCAKSAIVASQGTHTVAGIVCASQKPST